MTVARLELALDECAAEVWSYLTQSDRLPQWLAPGRIELEHGGAARLDFQDSGIVIDSRVTRCKSPRSLAYSWSSPGQPSRPVRWTLDPDDAGTHLTLELEIPEDEDMARAAAGWAAHLQMLQAALAGVPIKFPIPAFKAARDAYWGQLAHLP
jgi:uncharacterized protein YndB with AHSA1/START domain